MSVSVKRRFCLLFCLGMLLPFQRMASARSHEPLTRAPVQEAAAAPESDAGSALILDLTDSVLIARAWEVLYPDSAAPGGEYQILVPSGPILSTGQSSSSTVYLLRNGTEVGHIDRADWDALAAKPVQKGEPGWAASAEGPERQGIPLLWNALALDRESALRLADWPSGFIVGIGSSLSTIPSSKPQYHRDYDFRWNQKIWGRYLLGVELRRSLFGGGLSRLGMEVADTMGGRTPSAEKPDFWSDAYWSWSLSAGVPGLRYTLSLADQPLPEYYWLDPKAAEAIRERKSGKLVKQWSGPELALGGNLAHTLDARFGYLRYGIHIDADAYRVPVQSVGMDELPALFGTWGGGLLIASDLLATRVWLDIPDVGLQLGHPAEYPTEFRFVFLRLDFAYRDPKSFSMGFSVRVRVDNAIMNRPGA
jgi:hypothetical protein